MHGESGTHHGRLPGPVPRSGISVQSVPTPVGVDEGVARIPGSGTGGAHLCDGFPRQRTASRSQRGSPHSKFHLPGECPALLRSPIRPTGAHRRSRNSDITLMFFRDPAAGGERTRDPRSHAKTPWMPATQASMVSSLFSVPFCCRGVRFGCGAARREDGRRSGRRWRHGTYAMAVVPTTLVYPSTCAGAALLQRPWRPPPIYYRFRRLEAYRSENRWSICGHSSHPDESTSMGRSFLGSVTNHRSTIGTDS